MGSVLLRKETANMTATAAASATAQHQIKEKPANIDETMARDAARILHADLKNAGRPWKDILIHIKKLMAEHNEAPLIAEMEAARDSDIKKLPYKKEFVQNQINTMKRRQQATPKSIKEFGAITAKTLGTGSSADILRAEYDLVDRGLTYAASQLSRPNIRKTVLPYLSLEMAEYDTAALAAQVQKLTRFPVNISVHAVDKMRKMTYREKTAYLDTKIWFMTMFMPIVVASRERMSFDTDIDTDGDADTAGEQDSKDQEIEANSKEKYPDTS